MGDRCYMEVICKPEDVARFEDLGFTRQEDMESGLAYLVDEQADYGHSTEMPPDLVYYGGTGAGGSYGPEEFACEGKGYTAISSEQDGAGYMVGFNADGDPLPESLARVKEFIDLRKRVIKTLEAQPVTA